MNLTTEFYTKHLERVKAQEVSLMPQKDISAMLTHHLQQMGIAIREHKWEAALAAHTTLGHGLMFLAQTGSTPPSNPPKCKSNLKGKKLKPPKLKGALRTTSKHGSFSADVFRQMRDHKKHTVVELGNRLKTFYPEQEARELASKASITLSNAGSRVLRVARGTYRLV